jgi:hypothetical protein
MRRDETRRTSASRALAALWCGLLLSACATTEEAPAPRQYLDEHTAATVTVAAGGLVFARARPEYAVNARDYLTVVPVDVNRGGSHLQYLYSYVWSTIDKPPGAADKPTTFELIADGRQIPLVQVSTPVHSLGFGEIPVPPPARNALPLISATNREVLQFLARAEVLSVVATRDGIAERYDLWTDGRTNLDEFLHGGPSTR